MILRMWRAQSTTEKAGEYIQHAIRSDSRVCGSQVRCYLCPRNRWIIQRLKHGLHSGDWPEMQHHRERIGGSLLSLAKGVERQTRERSIKKAASRVPALWREMENCYVYHERT